MKDWYNHMYIVLLVISNAIAILQLFAAFKWPKIARLSFFILFGWACWINWKTALQTPEVYLEYADLSWRSWYSNFINGWFALHTKFAVGSIAICQGLIGCSMLLTGKYVRLECIGGIIFLVAILPLGIGSGFPCTAIIAISLLVLLKSKNQQLLWHKEKVVQQEVLRNKLQVS
jgi:hypothetical protein